MILRYLTKCFFLIVLLLFFLFSKTVVVNAANCNVDGQTLPGIFDPNVGDISALMTIVENESDPNGVCTNDACNFDGNKLSGIFDPNVGDISALMTIAGNESDPTGICKIGLSKIEECSPGESCIKLADVTISKGTTEVEVPISFNQITAGVGAVFVEIYYDSSKVTAVDAYAKEGELGSGGKTIKFNNIPAIAPSTISTARIAFIDDIYANGTSNGTLETKTLLSIKFNVLQTTTNAIPLELNVKSLADINSNQIALDKKANGLMTLQ